MPVDSNAAVGNDVASLPPQPLPPQPLRTSRQLGALLRSRRKTLRFTQAALAGKLGMSQNRVSELESAPEELTVRQLLQFLSALGLELTLQSREQRSATESQDAW